MLNHRILIAMKKFSLALIGAIIAIVSCEKKEQEVPVTSVSITQATAEMIIGETIQLSASVQPSNATEKTISWASSKISVATVSGGKVTAIAEGSSTITASCGGKSATCQVTVSKGIVAITSITLNKESISLIKGESEALVATIKPDDATDKTVTWSTSNAGVATVDNGKVTAVKEGEATIKAQAGGKEASCKVKVAAHEIGSISSDAAILHGAGGQTVVSITTGASWSVASDASWLTVSPSSGSAGAGKITVTSAPNTTSAIRTGTITVSSSGDVHTLSIRQRPEVRKTTLEDDANILNSLKLSYTGTKFTRIYAILPAPQTNIYQEITHLEKGSAELVTCPDGVNQYIVANLEGDAIPASGGVVISETFHARSYSLTAQLDQITDIPEYDPQSEVCQKYLGVEKGDLVNPKNAEIVSIAGSLWGEASGDLIAYARKCYEWTAANMKYGNMNTGLHTIANLMKNKTGDCGNFSSVFISLLRAKGIPARHIVMIAPQKKEYHVRAEFYIPAYGWIPADPTFKNGDPAGDYFGKFTGTYVVMSFGINSIIKNPSGADYTAALMQTAFYWYWYSAPGSGISFTHVFSKN